MKNLNSKLNKLEEAESIPRNKYFEIKNRLDKIN